PPFYDSMLARVIARAPSRPDAVARLAAALDATVCWGVPTNRPFLARVLRTDEFVGGAFDTTFLERRFADDAARATPAPTWLEAIAAASLAIVPRTPLPSLWSGWSSSPSIDALVPIEIAGTLRRWRLIGSPRSMEASCGAATHRIDDLSPCGDDPAASLDATVDGRAVRVAACLDGALAHWQAEGSELSAVDLRLRGGARAAAAASGTMVAPMHGRVTEACVEAGATVVAGALLVVIEAMKMEHQIRAPHAGTIAALHVRAGDQVAVRQPLVEVRA
ncbi:MAG TPA: biotin/lipoyl-containing protein, partial [Caldimonas sp.]|nr:biotin/lipoyl-containing protein [Caldimonas sp.]